MEDWCFKEFEKTRARLQELIDLKGTCKEEIMDRLEGKTKYLGLQISEDAIDISYRNKKLKGNIEIVKEK